MANWSNRKANLQSDDSPPIFEPEPQEQLPEPKPPAVAAPGVPEDFPVFESVVEVEWREMSNGKLEPFDRVVRKRVG